MNSSKLKSQSLSPSKIRGYFYHVPETPLTLKSSPFEISPERLKTLPTLSTPYQPGSPSKPHTFLNKLCKKSKLNLTIYSKEIFVLQDGSSVSTGQKLLGFNYTVTNNLVKRVDHMQEMKEFYTCCKDFFQTDEDFRFIYSHTGKALRCLHAVPIDTKIVLVSNFSRFQGINEQNLDLNGRVYTRSPCYRPNQINRCKSFKPTETLNSQFEFTTQIRSSATVSMPRVKILSRRPIKISNRLKLGRLEMLKMKLAKTSEKINKTFQSIHDQGLKQLKGKYKFTEGELHKLFAKFKLLVLMSCGVDPSHKPAYGVNKEAFIDYYARSEELRSMLSRIFDKIDYNKSGLLSWEDYLNGLNLMWYGSDAEKIDLFFDVCDKDGNGALAFAEIQGLCKIQLQGSNINKAVVDLSYNFASLIFDIAQADYKTEIPSSKIKEIVANQNDESIIDIFCNFEFIK